MQRIYVVLILLFLSNKVLLSQNENENLKSYLETNSLYDYGYGILKFEQPLDSVFCYNDFVNDSLYYNSTNNKLSYIKADSIFNIKLKKQKEYIQGINLLYKKNIISSKMLPDSFRIYTRIDKIYHFKLYNKCYMLFYLSDDYSLSSTWGSYLGILIDKEMNTIIIFPERQGTNSLLPITDIDSDKNVNYISYWPSMRNQVKIYSLKKHKFILEKKYTSTLDLFDGYIWHIDFKYYNFISDYYRLKWKEK